MITDDLKKRSEELKVSDPATSQLLADAAQQMTALTEQFTALSKRQSVAGKTVTLVASQKPAEIK